MSTPKATRLCADDCGRPSGSAWAERCPECRSARILSQDRQWKRARSAKKTGRRAYDPAPRACERCGTTYRPAQAIQRYCGETCKEAAKADFRRAREISLRGGVACIDCSARPVARGATDGRCWFCRAHQRDLARTAAKAAALAAQKAEHRCQDCGVSIAQLLRSALRCKLCKKKVEWARSAARMRAARAAAEPRPKVERAPRPPRVKVERAPKVPRPPRVRPASMAAQRAAARERVRVAKELERRAQADVMKEKPDFSGDWFSGWYGPYAPTLPIGTILYLERLEGRYLETA